MEAVEETKPSERGSLLTRVDYFILTAGIAAYALVNLATWWGSEPVTTWDSPRYTGGDIFLFLNPGIPPTVLFSAFDDARVPTLIQTILYAAAWSSLAAAIVVSLRSTWAKWPIAILALVASLTSPLWSWNLVVGSEGLTVTAIVFWISTFVWLATSSRTWAIVFNTAVACGLIVTRPQMLIFVIPIQIVATIWWVRRRPTALPSVRLPLVWLALLLVASTGWAAFRVALLANDDVYSFRYALHNLVEKTPSFRQYVLNEAPPCEAIPAALNGPQPWTDVIAFDNTLISQCPETFIWFKSDAVALQTWVAYNPGAAILNFRDVMWGIALPVGSEASALPSSLNGALLPVHNVWLATVIGLALGVILGLAGGVRYRVSWLGVLGTTTIVLVLLIYLFAVWAADGYDVIRHMVPVTPLLPVAAFALPTALTGRQQPIRPHAR